MIAISELTEAHKGRVAFYKSFDGYELGIISSWNNKYIFVVYPNNNSDKRKNWQNYTPVATDPADLSWENPDGCPCGTHGQCCSQPDVHTPEHECPENGEFCEECYCLECANCGSQCCCDL